jgi:hypothetical protein
LRKWPLISGAIFPSELKIGNLPRVNPKISDRLAAPFFSQNNLAKICLHGSP